ncbi:hypothetical protein [Pseudaminobacter soli (ex Li et al. 2025)]|uniref:Uncharacterized protein n=1 Tax=Pseudaminobacter soli (ex Li et al. 2025) TaxID=1295366 RepID=A0A2P7S636_9HYPH|nr:hypothetical protein [Mesorhizobium soli]PSJ57881.1 hypothetical protein C7I85_21160 [Mesorhizobium soli]
MELFTKGVASGARELLDTHLALPQEVHYVADLQRWILSQVTIALHFEHRLDPACPPISPSNLLRAIKDTKVASRNTVHTFLMEMKRYRFITPLASEDLRLQAAQATEMSELLIRRYFDIHLRALDTIDNGQRYALSCRHPDILQWAQPRFARLLLALRDWYRPPQTIAKFDRSASGSSILHELVIGVPPLSAEMTSPIWIGKVSPNAFSQKYRISRTHAARLFGIAREAGLIGWANRSNRGECWISPQLVRDYRYWQAVKLAAVSQAFHEACIAMNDARVGNPKQTEPGVAVGSG